MLDIAISDCNHDMARTGGGLPNALTLLGSDDYRLGARYCCEEVGVCFAQRNGASDQLCGLLETRIASYSTTLDRMP